MPPQTRRNKTLKENITTSSKNKVKKNVKAKRKPLADKTNSASDDNVSNLSSNKILKKKDIKTTELTATVKERVRRTRRLPTRYKENEILINLSNNSFNSLSPPKSSTPLKPKETLTKANHSKVRHATPTRSSNSPLKHTEVRRSCLTTRTGELSVPTKKERTTNKMKNKMESIKYISFRLLDDKKKPKRNSSKLDIYEFTFDPNEEPPPKKKKQKRTVKNPSKPKKVVKSIYDKNLERAMAALKNAVSCKQKTRELIQRETNDKDEGNKESVSDKKLLNTNPNVSEISENKYNSIRVEDIAMQFQESCNYDHNNIDYSPINSPEHAPSPIHTDVPSENLVQPLSKPIEQNVTLNSEQPAINKDPLNLLENLSFFDEEPVASSSINVSRDPTASPWRVEFNNLPIKWQVNSYVKPNMTPAIESSFVNYNDSQKKHVYTNIITDTNETQPQIHDIQQPPSSNLKQTSIISFIKEVVEKKENKKRQNKVVKNNSLFEDSHVSDHIPPRKKNNIPDVIFEERSNASIENQSVNENLHPQHNNSGESEGLKDLEQLSEKGKDKDITYFGFDDNENQENVSPIKKKTKKKIAKHQTRSVLQIINGEGNCNSKMPMPLAAMSKPARIPDNINKVFEETKTATEPPAFMEQSIDKNNEITNVNDNLIQSTIEDDDSQSVHLFEDIELIHHLKPCRKSYGKSKKVTFHQNSTVHNEDFNIERGSSDEDNLDDLSFKLPTVKEKKVTKKKTKKQQKTKKEEKEAEAWAAGFNSMCEDIEEFDLVVE